MQRRGFTIIELMIVIAIIAILLVLGTLGLRGYTAHVRDKEREADIAAIQQYLESIYPQEIRDSSGTIIKPAGSYPAHVFNLSDGDAVSEEDFMAMFADLRDDVKKGPSDREVFISANAGIMTGGRHISVAADIVRYQQDYRAYRPQGRPNGAYIYFAKHYNGSKCTQRGDECRQYSLMYHLETKDPSRWQVAEGRHK